MRFSSRDPGFESCVYSNPSSSDYERDVANAVSGEGLIISTTTKNSDLNLMVLPQNTPMSERYLEIERMRESRRDSERERSELICHQVSQVDKFA